MGHGSKEEYKIAAGSILTLLLVGYVLSAILTETEAKGMGRGVNRSGGGSRTYLKKFGNRNVVYQRKIFNTKYHTGDEIGTVGSSAKDKFKRRLSDGNRRSTILRLDKSETPAGISAPSVPVIPPAAPISAAVLRPAIAV